MKFHQVETLGRSNAYSASFLVKSVHVIDDVGMLVIACDEVRISPCFVKQVAAFLEWGAEAGKTFVETGHAGAVPAVTTVTGGGSPSMVSAKVHHIIINEDGTGDTILAIANLKTRELDATHLVCKLLQFCKVPHILSH